MFFDSKIVVNGNVYNSIPYDELGSSATHNEKIGFVPGNSSIGDMGAVCVFFVVIVLLLIIIVHNVINFIYVRKTLAGINKE